MTLLRFDGHRGCGESAARPRRAGKRGSRYTTHNHLEAAYKLDKEKYCRWCRKHVASREKKL